MLLNNDTVTVIMQDLFWQLNHGLVDISAVATSNMIHFNDREACSHLHNLIKKIDSFAIVEIIICNSSMACR